MRADSQWDPRAVRLLGLAVGVPAVVFAYGVLRVPSGAAPVLADTRLRIVQPNVPQSEKWREDLLARNWRALIEPLRVAPGTQPYTVAIWPEAAPPFLLAESPQALAVIAATLPRGAVLATGAQYREPRPEGGYDFYNGFHIIGDEGRVRDSYAKAHLVPFGEYLPFADVLERLGVTKITGGRGGFKSGPGVRPVTLSPHSTSGSLIGVLICYEALFPGAVVRPGERPLWLVNVTDDSWFGPSSGPYQHLGIARFRAVEEGLSLVRAANTGVSAVIDPYGRITHALSLNHQGVIDAPVAAPLGKTMYAQWGNVLYALAMAMLAGLGVGVRWPFLARALGVRG
jgi:apolipoprotein N-acyltransferase